MILAFANGRFSIKDEYGSSLLPSASTAGNWNYNNDLTE